MQASNNMHNFERFGIPGFAAGPSMQHHIVRKWQVMQMLRKYIPRAIFSNFFESIARKMNTAPTSYIYLLGTIAFTVYGQVILKWRIMKYGALPQDFLQKTFFLFKLLIDPFILSGLIAAFAASLLWMAAMTKFDISYAYPFMSLSFVLVFILSVLLFGEPFSFYKIVGLSFIVIGVVVTSRSY